MRTFENDAIMPNAAPSGKTIEIGIAFKSDGFQTAWRRMGKTDPVKILSV